MTRSRSALRAESPGVSRSGGRRDLVESLQGPDWDFPAARTQDGTHGIHPYPAKFIPQIPRELLRIVGLPQGSIVLDPFCGSGTALVEAQAAGMVAVGIDVSPLATMIARVKTHPPARRLGPLASQTVIEARGIRAPIPQLPRLDHWFRPDVQQALANILHVLQGIGYAEEREALQIALSSIIVRVSNQESDTRYAAVRKRVSAPLVYEVFQKAAAGIDIAYEEQFGGLFQIPRAPVTVLTRDTLSVKREDLPARGVSLVITSPPYPNAYEYWLYHKYRMYWLGMDPLAVREREIGARPLYFRKNHQTEVDFERQMATVFGLLAAVLLESGLVCVLVGRSVIHGRTIDNAALLARVAAQHGFSEISRIQRAIPAHRKTFNPAHGNIKSEALMVFAR